MIKRSKIALFISVLMIAGLATWITTRREWVQNKVLDAAIETIAPSLPFKVVSYQLSKDRDFLEFELLWNSIPIHIGGALDTQWHGNHFGWTVHYVPEVKLGDATPLKLIFDLEAPTDFDQLNKVTLSLDPTQADFIWKRFGIDVQKPTLNISVLRETGNIALGFSSASATWTDPTNENHAISLQNPEITALKSKHQIEANLNSASGEMLWDKIYAELPMKELPFRVVTPDQKNFDLAMGKTSELKVAYKIGDSGSPSILSWKTGKFDHTKLIPWLVKTITPLVPSLSGWSDLEVKRGKLSIKGEAQIHDRSGFQLRDLLVDAVGVGVRSFSHHLAIRSLSFQLPYREVDSEHRFVIELSDAYYKKVPFTLAKTNFVWSPSTKKGLLKTEEAIALKAAGIPVQFGKVEGTLGPNDEDRFQFSTSLKVESDHLEALGAGFCLPAQRFPPAKLKIDFNEIEVSPGVIDPSGKAELQLFKGKIVLNEFGVYDYQSDVPEINFDLDWAEIDLKTMGEWSNFGEILGTLEGHAHDVVFQAFLPTQYDFLLQVQSLDRHEAKPYIEFSPEAMKNVVKIFTGEDLDEQIPGIAGWMMFGWPSRVFGGYDVEFAGISVESSNGVIVVETLDPPQLVEETRKHFILYGPRFKMPIRSMQYPLVLDATAMSNFVHQMLTRFMSLKGDEDEKPEECNPPEL